MSEHDHAEQISDALARLRWQARAPRPMGPFGPGPHRHRGWGGEGGIRGAGGPALWRLLRVLGSAETPLTVSDIAERIGVDQPRASRLVAQAVEFGLVRREADPVDGRRSLAALTEEGAAVAQRFRDRHGAQVREALQGFSEADRAQLAALLGRLAEAWPTHDVGGRL